MPSTKGMLCAVTSPNCPFYCTQITMKFNHNGTHIEGMGLKHGEHRVIFNINAHDSLEGEMRSSLCLQNRELPAH